jgi:tetratricopeptide (TPR) repeat protein
MGRHAPNEALRALLEEAGWTHEQLALAVNGIAKESDVHLRYDRTAVAHWLGGASPRPAVRGYLLEAFHRRLRRYVTAGETGLESQSAAAAAAGGAVGMDCDGVMMLRDLCAAVLDERCRSRTLAQPYSAEPRGLLSAAGAALNPVALGAESATDDPRSSAIGKAVAAFGASLLSHGGAFAPETCATFLAERVVPYLESQARPGASLAAGAARLTHLLGDMYADDLRHGVAQQCFLVSAQLAGSAPRKDEVLLVIARAGLQAYELAVDGAARPLVRTAAEHAGADASLAVQVAVLVGSAAGEAAAGARESAGHSLRQVDRAMRSAWVGQEQFDPVEAELFAVAARHWGQVYVALGDQMRAAQAWQLALSHVPSRHLYVRALLYAELGALHTQLGDWRRAGVAWEAFVGLYPAVDSRRARRALVGLEGALRRSKDQPEARALRAKLRALPRRRRSQLGL